MFFSGNSFFVILDTQSDKHEIILVPFWVPGGGPARLGVPRVYLESFLSVFCDFAARPNLGPDAFTSIKTVG